MRVALARSQRIAALQSSIWVRKMEGQIPAFVADRYIGQVPVGDDAVRWLLGWHGGIGL